MRSASAANTGSRSGSVAETNNSAIESATAATAAATRRKRGMSRFDVAATYAREPARAKSLSIAQARAAGRSGSSNSSSAPDGGRGSSSSGVPGGGINNNNNNQNHNSDDDSEQVTCFESIHKLHLVTSVFAFLGFTLGMVSFLTDYWYVTRLGDSDPRHNGLFWDCFLFGCIETDFRDLFWSTDCTIPGDTIRWAYYLNRGFIFTAICSCVVAFVLIAVSKQCYNSSWMRGQSWAVLVFMTIPLICWAVAIGRFAMWQNSELYCGATYCDIKFKTTKEVDCEEGFGWSFSLAVLCLVFHFFGVGFAIARHCFGEWTLEEAEGEDLAATTTRVNVEHTVKTAKKNAAAAAASKTSGSGGSDGAPTEDNRSTNNNNGGAQGNRRGRAMSVIPLVRNDARAKAEGKAALIGAQRRDSAAAEPYGNTEKHNHNDDDAQEDFAAVLRAQQEESMQADDWEFDAESGLEWSETLYMYRDPQTKHLFDSNSNLWYDPVLKNWYAGEEDEEPVG